MPEPKFKIGDKVRVIKHHNDGAYELPMDEIFTIKSIHSSHDESICFWYYKVEEVIFAHRDTEFAEFCFEKYPSMLDYYEPVTKGLP